MKLGIFGDSYSTMPESGIGTLSEDVPWMTLAKQQLSCSMKTHSLQGTSLWFSFEKFMKYHDKYTHIVFCYTEASRVNYMPAHLAQYSVFKEASDINHTYISASDADELSVIINAQKIGYNHHLDLFIYQHIFEKINEICFSKNIKLTNLITTPNPLDLRNKQGDCLLNLGKVSSKESILSSSLYHDNRCCHLSKENNIVLADIITKSLLNGSRAVLELEKNSNFVFSEEISNRYFKI